MVFEFACCCYLTRRELKPDVIACRIVRDLYEFDWRELTAPQGAGAWPASVKTGIVLLLTAFLLAGGYLLRLREQQERDALLGVEEVELAAELERLKRSVANLDGYRQQARESRAL